MPAMVDLRLSYSEEQRERFRNRVLSHEWREQYPDVFDEDDLRLATGGPQCRKNHFFEWLAAVRLFELIGYHSLVEKYDCRNHLRKHAAFRQVVGL